jgi:hypothetical protein
MSVNISYYASCSTVNSILSNILRARSFLNKCLLKLNHVICNYYFSFIVVLLTCHSYHHHFDLHKQGCSDYTNYHFCGYDGESVFVLIYYSVIVQFLLIISGDVAQLQPRKFLRFQYFIKTLGA